MYGVVVILMGNIITKKYNFATKTLLHTAHKAGAEEIVRLIQQGADVNAADNYELTPLMLAAWRNSNPDVLRILIENGANINTSGRNGKTPLMFAIKNNTNPDAVLILIESGASLDASDKDGKTALMFAASKKPDSRIMSALIEKGANINATDNRKLSPLMLAACFNKNTDILRILIEKGANVNAVNKDGKSALMLAIEKNRNLEIFQLLINERADVNAANNYGDTPLIQAAFFNSNPKVIRILLDNGADAAVKNFDGKRAFDYAEENEDLKQADAYDLLRDRLIVKPIHCLRPKDERAVGDISQAEISYALHELFPDGIYPPAEFERFLAEKQYGLAHAIEKQKGGSSVAEWMKRLGFEPLETEMKPRVVPDAIAGCTEEILKDLVIDAFYKQPLLGNVNPNKKQLDFIYDYARNILIRSLNKEYYPVGFDRDILVLGTVLLLRNWNGDERAEGESDNASFWEYICNQYAISYDSNFGGSFTYSLFRKAITDCFTAHNRLFAQGGKKYYTSLLTHALAPKRKFDDLFEQVFLFYTKSLRYKFIEDDTAFTAFSFAMKTRFSDGIKNSEEDVYIKSLQSSSAIKLLFMTCPYYMASFVNNIIRNIDLLVSNGVCDDNTYTGSLLKTWYAKRSLDIRTKDRAARHNYASDFVETDFSRIKLSYQLIHRNGGESAALVVPAIRFGEQAEELPQISIYCGDKLIYKENIRWFGDHYCITGVRTEIDLNDMENHSEAGKISIKAIISYDGRDIYCSENRLYRDAIVFDTNGAEIVKPPELGEIFYLYAPLSAKIDEAIDNSPQCVDISSGGAQLFRVMMGNDTYVIVNGITFFPIPIIAVDELLIEIQTRPVAHVSYVFAGQEHSIFAASPQLNIATVKSTDKQYRVSIDGSQQPLPIYRDSGKESWSVPLPENNDAHEVLIIDNETNYVVYFFRYIVVEKFNLRFNGYYPFIDDEAGSVTILDKYGERGFLYKIAADESNMRLPYHSGELLIDIPILKCRLNGKDLLADRRRTIWHKDIPMSDRLEIEPPRGYAVSVLFCNNEYEASQAEIGNITAAAKPGKPIETVSLRLCKSDGVARYSKDFELFDVVFKPCFKAAPVLFEDAQLLWRPEDNFIGDHDTKFILYLRRKGQEIASYALKYDNEILEHDFPYGKGIYEYSITVQETGFFSMEEEQEIYKSELILGDAEEFRFDGKAVVVTVALIGNNRIKLEPNSCIITGLKYLGVKPLNGEDLPYPCFEGCMQYLQRGKYRTFSDNEHQVGRSVYEAVNPVKLWIINDYNISLRSSSDDGLYVNKEYKRITDIKPNKDNRHYYDNPDYYLYRIDKET